MENENVSPATAETIPTPAVNVPAPVTIFWNGQEFMGQAAINVIADRLERLEAGGGLSSNDVDSIRGLLRTFEQRLKQLESQAGATAGAIHQIIQTVNLQGADIARLQLQVQTTNPGPGAGAPWPGVRPVLQQVPEVPARSPLGSQQETEADRPFSVCPLCTNPAFYTKNPEEFNAHMAAGDHKRGGQ